MEGYTIFILITYFSCVSAARPHYAIYRNDYDYNDITKAFYKFHPEPRRNAKAVEVCALEGAELIKIESPADLTQAHAMFKVYYDLSSSYAWVKRDGVTHESADQRPIIQLSEEVIHLPFNPSPIQAGECDVMSRAGDMETRLCFSSQPFICKVKADVAPYDSRCRVYGTDYVYVESIGSCYKIPSSPYSWNEAYAECRAEGAHLLVLNSEAESLAVQNLTRVATVGSSYVPWFFFVGYRAQKPQGSEPVVFKTIFNQTLEEAGFNEWSPNEPNNAHGNEYCGSFFNNNAKLNDVNCYNELGFICEKEVKK